MDVWSVVAWILGSHVMTGPKIDKVPLPEFPTVQQGVYTGTYMTCSNYSVAPGALGVCH